MSKDAITFNEESLEDLRKTFRLFDVDNDGKITADELEKVITKLTGIPPSKSDLRDMLNEVDEDKSGTIEFNEFLRLMQRRQDQLEEDSDQDLREAFKIFDRDGNQKIDHEELKLVMHNLGESLTDDQIHEMLVEADKDGDGFISFEEFRQMMSK